MKRRQQRSQKQKQKQKQEKQPAGPQPDQVALEPTDSTEHGQDENHHNSDSDCSASTSTSSEEPCGVELGRREDDTDCDESDVEGEFEFFDPRQDDLPPLRALLAPRFGSLADPLARAAVAQTRVGATIKVDGQDSEPVGLVTILNLSVHSAATEGIVGGGASELKSWVQRARDGLEGQVGLLLFERVINLPVELVPWAQEAVFNEVDWAVEDEKDEAQKKAFALDYLIYITDVYMEQHSAAPNSGQSMHTKKQKKKKRAAPQDSDSSVAMAFVRLEDPIYYAAADATVAWSVDGEPLRRMLMRIPYSKAIQIRTETKKLLPAAARMDEQ